MSQMSQFDRHVFISYAHIDNVPLSQEQQGWITRFHAALDAMLSMRLGRKANIWRDVKLSGDDVFAEEIVSQFKKVAVLVSVVSPRYIESDWCTREVREFCDAAQRDSSLIVDNKSRVIKVIKTPVDSEDVLPAVMKQVLGYPFFTVDEAQTPIELDPAYGPELGQKYNLKMATLAWNIAELVKKLEASEVAGRATTEAPKPTIYLSECSWDRREAREALKSELRVHGYQVLPDAELPRDEDAYITEVRKLLRRSAVSVHLIGNSYGAVPDGPSQKSIVVLQNELAVAAARERTLPRIIWIPEGTQGSDAQQQQFIAALHTTEEAQFGADLITGDIEVVKGIVRAALKRIETPPAPTRAPADLGVSKLIYLICDAADSEATKPLRKTLHKAGIDVEIPLFVGDAGTVQKNHDELLTQCDMAIVYYAAGDEAWKRTVENDIRKANAYRKEKGPLQRFTYLAPPATAHKKDMIDVEEANLIDDLDGTLDPSAVLSIISGLRSA